MSDTRDISWFRLLDNVVGLIVIVVAILAILELSFSFVYALEILLIGLLAMGIAWVAMGIYVLCDYTFARIFMLITGFAAIAIAILDFVFISLPLDYLVIYPTIAMLLVGSSRLVLGFFVSEIPLWIRMLQVLAGIMTVNFVALVYFFPVITFQGVIILLVITFFANGLVRLIVGRTDTKQQILRTAGIGNS